MLSFCSYSKAEGLLPGSHDLLHYTILLISAKDLSHYSSSHDLLHKEQGMGRLSVTPRQFPPIRLLLEDKIYVLKKKKAWLVQRTFKLMYMSKFRYLNCKENVVVYKTCPSSSILV